MKETKIAFVSVILKTYNSKYDTYKSISFSVCLDSKKCNNTITSINKLKKITKKVNNMK